MVVPVLPNGNVLLDVLLLPIGARRLVLPLAPVPLRGDGADTGTATGQTGTAPVVTGHAITATVLPGSIGRLGVGGRLLYDTGRLLLLVLLTLCLPTAHVGTDTAGNGMHTATVVLDANGPLLSGESQIMVAGTNGAVIRTGRTGTRQGRSPRADLPPETPLRVVTYPLKGVQ